MHKIHGSNFPALCMYISLSFQYFTCIRPNVIFFQGLSVFILFPLAVLFLTAKNYSQLQEKDFTIVSIIYSNKNQELCDRSFPADYKLLKGKDVDLFIYKLISFKSRA